MDETIRFSIDTIRFTYRKITFYDDAKAEFEFIFNALRNDIDKNLFQLCKNAKEFPYMTVEEFIKAGRDNYFKISQTVEPEFLFCYDKKTKKILGYISYEILDTYNGKITFGIYVSPTARKKKVGTNLFMWLMDKFMFKDQQMNKIVIHINGDNDASLNFHRKCFSLNPWNEIGTFNEYRLHNEFKREKQVKQFPYVYDTYFYDVVYMEYCRF